MNITNEIVTDYINDFYIPLNDDLANLRKAAEAECIPIILRDTEMMLKSLVLLQKPKNILEIGTAVGYSAAFFASLDKNCRVTTVEASEPAYEKAIANIDMLGLSGRVQVYLGDGGNALEDLGPMPKFDLVFIDAAKSYYKQFWDAAIPHCSKGALIVSDNVLLKGKTASDEFDPAGKSRTNIEKMRAYLAYLMIQQGVDTSVIAVGDGLAISILKG